MNMKAAICISLVMTNAALAEGTATKDSPHEGDLGETRSSLVKINNTLRELSEVVEKIEILSESDPAILMLLNGADEANSDVLKKVLFRMQENRQAKVEKAIADKVRLEGLMEATKVSESKKSVNPKPVKQNKPRKAQPTRVLFNKGHVLYTQVSDDIGVPDKVLVRIAGKEKELSEGEKWMISGQSIKFVSLKSVDSRHIVLFAVDGKQVAFDL